MTKIPFTTNYFKTKSEKLNFDFNDIPKWVLAEIPKLIKLHVRKAIKEERATYLDPQEIH